MQADVLAILLMSVIALGTQGHADDVAHAVALAKAELQRSARVAPEAVALVSADATEWRDSALGCPQRGMVYTPVITPGYIVRLRAGSELYAVHVGDGRAVVCGAAARTAGTETKLTSDDAVVGLKRADEARADLAKALGVPLASIVVDFYRATTWPDARLGCAGDAPASPERVRGFLIQLSTGGKTYAFHSDAMNRPRRCDGGSPPKR